MIFALSKIVVMGIIAVGLASQAEGEHLAKGLPPNCIAEAVVTLDNALDESEKNRIKETERNDLVDFHFTYGLRMRNQWGLGTESSLARQFVANGIYRPDDMSSLLLDIYWKHLNGLSLDLEESVAELRRDYDELASEIDGSGVDLSGDIVPLPDPSKVKDRIIEVP